MENLISCIEKQLEYVDFYMCCNYFSVPYNANSNIYCCEIGREFYSSQFHKSRFRFNMFIRHDLETNKFYDFWLSELYSGRTQVFIKINKNHYLLKYSERGGRSFAVKVPLNFNHTSKLSFIKSNYITSLSQLDFDNINSQITFILVDFFNALNQFLSYTNKRRKNKINVLSNYFPEVPFITEADYVISKMKSKAEPILSAFNSSLKLLNQEKDFHYFHKELSNINLDNDEEIIAVLKKYKLL